MRKKLDAETKRSLIIGIKVKPSTKSKLQYLAGMQGDALSTYINNILEAKIEESTRIYKIDWSKVNEE